MFNDFTCGCECEMIVIRYIAQHTLQQNFMIWLLPVGCQNSCAYLLVFYDVVTLKIRIDIMETKMWMWRWYSVFEKILKKKKYEKTNANNLKSRSQSNGLDIMSIEFW